MRKFKTQFDKRPVKDGIFPCDKILPDDLVDPKYDKDEPKHVPNRKALQLCSQVKDTLNLSLSQLGDALLRDSYVESVIPAPDSSQLLVVLVSKNDPNEVFKHIQNASGLLRSQVASGINRKRVPQLKWNVKF